jgi:hypothetical protein
MQKIIPSTCEGRVQQRSWVYVPSDCIQYEQLLLVELNLFLRTLRCIGESRCSSTHHQLWHWIENRGRIAASVALPTGTDLPTPPERESGWTPQSVWTIWRRHGPTHMLGIEVKYFCCPVPMIITKQNALSQQLIMAESKTTTVPLCTARTQILNFV